LELTGAGLALPAQSGKNREENKDEASEKIVFKTHFVLLRLLGITRPKEGGHVFRLATLLP
jgi:hypothetical protein